jgi:hypothetical protein
MQRPEKREEFPGSVASRDIIVVGRKLKTGRIRYFVQRASIICFVVLAVKREFVLTEGHYCTLYVPYPLCDKNRNAVPIFLPLRQYRKDLKDKTERRGNENHNYLVANQRRLNGPKHSSDFFTPTPTRTSRIRPRKRELGNLEKSGQEQPATDAG